MRPFLNTNNLFVKEIQAGVSKQQVVNELQKHCPRSQGLVVVPVDYDSGATMGMAYMNYNSKEDGASGAVCVALEALENAAAASPRTSRSVCAR